MEVFGIFGFPAIMIILIVWLKGKERVKLYQLQADLYAKFLEKGQSVPAVSANWFAEPEKKKKNTSLNAGIICMAAGIGIALTVWLMFILLRLELKGADEVLILFKVIGSIGIIPCMIGIAFLIIHFVEKKKEAIRESLKNAK